MVGSDYGGNADYGGIMLIMVGSDYCGIHLLRGNCTHVCRKRMGGWYLVGWEALQRTGAHWDLLSMITEPQKSHVWRPLWNSVWSLEISATSTTLILVKAFVFQLLERLTSKGKRQPEFTRELIKKKLTDDEDGIATTNLKVQIDMFWQKTFLLGFDISQNLLYSSIPRWPWAAPWVRWGCRCLADRQPATICRSRNLNVLHPFLNFDCSVSTPHFSWWWTRRSQPGPALCATVQPSTTTSWSMDISRFF